MKNAMKESLDTYEARSIELTQIVPPIAMRSLEDILCARYPPMGIMHVCSRMIDGNMSWT